MSDMSSYLVKKSQRISVAIKALRDKLGETHVGMAQRLGASLRTYDRWEAGDAIPRGNMLVKILALCRDDESRSLFDLLGSPASKASGEHAALSSLRRWSPGDRLRMGFRNSCLASIEIIFEAAVLGSPAADEKLRSYATELNREAVLLTEGLFRIRHPPEVSRQQDAEDQLSGIRPSRKTNSRSRNASEMDSPAAKPDGP